MGSGGLVIDAMPVAIGCLGVERRGERFFVLSHFLDSEAILREFLRESVCESLILYFGSPWTQSAPARDQLYDLQRLKNCI